MPFKRPGIKRQRVLFFPHDCKVGQPPIPVELDEKPYRIWTLYHHTDPDCPPELPFVPVHNQNCFLEDFVHDWTWKHGKLRYYSRVSEGKVWLLLEYTE